MVILQHQVGSHSGTELSQLVERARARNIVEYADQCCGIALTRRGKEHWARCVFHSEETPSLAFNAEKGVYYCHGCGAGGDVLDFAMTLHQVGFPEAVQLVAAESASPPAPEPKEPRRLLRTTRYDVPHATEPIIATHVRQDYSDGTKQMWWLRDGKRGLQGLPLTDLALYGADAIRDADEVLIVEGEQARDVAYGLGVVTVGTATGASGTPSDVSLVPLVGKHVHLWPDADDDGRKHMDRIAERLLALGQPPEKITLVTWHGAPVKGDVADYAAAGGTVNELRAMLGTAPAWEPSTTGESFRPAGTKVKTSRLVIRTMSTVTTKHTDWLWKGWLARGKLHLFGGHAGDGKSTLLAQFAAIGSVAGTWPDGSHAPSFRTLFLLGEDALDDTLRPRLDLHGADTSQVSAIETVLDDDGRERFFNVEKHLPLLEAAVIEHEIDVLIIDPLTTVMAGRDRNAEGDTRDSLTPLVKFGERHNIAMVGVAHVGKPGAGQRTAAQRILGATAFHAMARVVWMTVPAGEGLMVFGVVKSNLAMKRESLLWSRAEDGPIVWHGISDQSVEDLVQGVVSKAPRADAEGFLRELLTAGSMASSDVEIKAKQAGIAWRTLRRAADAIGVMKWKQGGADGRWFWRLPDGQPRFPEPASHGPASNLSTFPGVANFDGRNLASPIDSDVDKLDTFQGNNLSTGLAGGQVHVPTQFSQTEAADSDANGMEGVQLGHTAVLGSGQVPMVLNGHGRAIADVGLPIDCLTPALCGGTLGRCDRAPRCRVNAPVSSASAETGGTS
jgi:hypothetical protein